MIFVYKKWVRFCAALAAAGQHSIPAREVTADMPTYLVLKHDVETKVENAYRLARIEQAHGHRGSYYVQAYLLHDEKNIRLLQGMQDMGHEISYHYDVMDSCHGDLDKAIREFEDNRQLFEENGFSITTVCQHGNPVVERVGYTSNRDFFRSERVCALYPHITDIMVNYSTTVPTEYLYFSDAGRKFKLIYDPINNDLVNSNDQNVVCRDLCAVQAMLTTDRGNIISTHPHRWTRSAVLYVIKAGAFRVVRGLAKLLIKIPFMKKWMSKYYYFAKKI